jgi:hypothetical protein
MNPYYDNIIKKKAKDEIVDLKLDHASEDKFISNSDTKDLQQLNLLENKSKESKMTDNSDDILSNEELKKSIFKSVNIEDNKRMVKLLKNRLCAKKCRDKKKNHTKFLEENLKKLTNEISQIKADSTKSNIVNLINVKLL